jgi:hypothetical protein
MSVNVGPLAPSVNQSENIPRNPRADGYGYNPRCLRRDVNSYFTTQFIRPIDIANHINSTSDMLTFETTLQTDVAKVFCLHTSGHYTIWGDPGGDFYVSPGELLAASSTSGSTLVDLAESRASESRPAVQGRNCILGRRQPSWTYY